MCVFSQTYAGDHRQKTEKLEEKPCRQIMQAEA